MGFVSSGVLRHSETLHPYIFNFGLSKHDSSCILIFSINMDGIETFFIEMTSN